ncbi:hypothetical protein G9A89_019632 [Geosiphon pyriformis]|nr:hypothetical protein G9A89_019632 [Geosiphon pyriformis]
MVRQYINRFKMREFRENAFQSDYEKQQHIKGFIKMFSKKRETTQTGKKSLFRKFLKPTSKIGGKSKNFYKYIKCQVFGKRSSNQPIPYSTAIPFTAINDSHNLSVTCREFDPASFKTNTIVPETNQGSSIVLETQTQEIKPICNNDLLGQMNILMDEVAMNISPKFYQEPEFSAIQEKSSNENDSEDLTISLYDAAWISLVPVSDYIMVEDQSHFRLAFPESLVWLINSQVNEASQHSTEFGNIPTALACLFALGMFRERSGPYFQSRIQELGLTMAKFNQVFSRGELFLQDMLGRLTVDDGEHLAGFELMTTYHLAALEKLNPPVFFVFPAKRGILGDRYQNLFGLSLEEIFHEAAKIQATTNLSSLMPPLHFKDYSKHQTQNFQDNNHYGTLSAAAIAAHLTLSQEWNKNLYERLETSVLKNKSISQKLDIGTLETYWMIYCIAEKISEPLIETEENTLLLSNLNQTKVSFQSFIKYIKTRVATKGSRSSWFDSKSRSANIDEIAVGNYLVSSFDKEHRDVVQPMINYFWNDECFLSFKQGKDFSISSNIHALELLVTEREKAKKRQEFPLKIEILTKNSRKINADHIIHTTIDFVISQRDENGCWFDKCHASPWYPTLRTLRFLFKLPQYPKILSTSPFRNKPALLRYCRESVEQALFTQHNDGSWGERFGEGSIGNLEETTYVVRLLKAAKEYWINDWEIDIAIAKGEKLIAELFIKSMTEKNYFYDKQPFLWQSEVSYTVPRVIRASVLLSLWDNSL